MKFTGVMLSIALTVPGLAADGAASRGWDRLGQVPRTQQVKVQLMDGSSISGVIQETEQDGLVFIHEKQVTKIPRENVREVTRRSRSRGALWGAIGGLAAGAPLGAAYAYVYYDGHPSGGNYAGQIAAIGALGSAVGVGIGAAVGGKETLYQSGMPIKPIGGGSRR